MDLMRQVKEHITEAGERRYRVRYRRGGTQSSETFRRKADATTFAAILSVGGEDGVVEALAWLDARSREAEESLTFGEWFETYLTQLTGITARTRDGYRSLHRNHLAHLDDLPLPLLTRSHVAALVNELDASGRSPKTIKNVIHMLSSCLALAIDEDHISKNPCKRIRLPGRTIGDSEPRFLTHDEFARFISCVPVAYQPFVVFLVGTGLRWSEATALQCRHVDLEAGTVAVRQAWKQGSSRDLGPPKSEKSWRTVNAATMALKAAAPLMRRPDDWMFTTPGGALIRHGNFHNRVWQPAREAAELPALRIHDLRHTHASWLISDGQSLEAVQDQLGHESILTTRKIYGHLQPAIGVEVGRSASAALDRALPRGLDGMQPRALSAVPEASGDPDDANDL